MIKIKNYVLNYLLQATSRNAKVFLNKWISVFTNPLTAGKKIPKPSDKQLTTPFHTKIQKPTELDSDN